MKQELLNGVSLFKNSGIRMEKSRVIYFDPYLVNRKVNDADVVFISHSHHDHMDIGSIGRVARSDTVVIAPEDCVDDLEAAGFSNILAVTPMKDYEVLGLKFRTVPMYNIGKKFHTKDKNWVGYVVYIDGASYYFAGDTDFIPEMEEIQADVAFLPVGGTYTMTAEEAAKAANAIKPRIAVPMHYADVAGKEEDAGIFLKGLAPGIEGTEIKIKR